MRPEEVVAQAAHWQVIFPIANLPLLLLLLHPLSGLEKEE